ncbi:heavy-metal-associated domain-containing protein [Rhodococcus sp. O3]|uniref:heavy-metal-associated domain-containing protein n=1 Tax=Rhodococcus sp. O3 TaxID=3404919 RepID=UPI003B681EA4
MQNTYRVEGMTCGHCVSAVREEISAIPGVSEVDVNLETGTVVVTSDTELDPQAVADAVDEAGYALVA